MKRKTSVSFGAIASAGVIAALLLALSAQAQVHSGSLVVFIVSKQSNYVVIGAESRAVDLAGNFDDRSCKIISLGGDTLFYGTGSAEIGVHHGKHWSSEGTARSVYGAGQGR